MDQMQSTDQTDPPEISSGGVSVDPSQKALVDKWWEITNDLPDHDEGCIAADECRKAITPNWFDVSDPHKGNKQREIRNRNDDRQVKNFRVAKLIQQSVAMTVPDDHSFKFDTDVLIGETTINPRVRESHDTLEALCRSYSEESQFTQYAQETVYNAHVERLAILKMTFQREFIGEPIHMSPERRDQADNVERLRHMLNEYQLGKIKQGCAEYAEMLNLKTALKFDSEIRVWEGVVFDVIPYAAFGWDPTIRSFNNVYNAKWMYHEAWKTQEELVTLFPIRQSEDGTTVGCDANELMEMSKNIGNMTSTGSTKTNSYRSDKGPTPNAEAKGESNRVRIREIWSRKDNRVLVICEGVPRPLASYVPKRTSANWYPFYLLRLNPRPFAVDGIADVEFVKDIQDRINRKRTDEEKARWLSLPRGYGSALDVDQREVDKMGDQKPGTIRLYNIKTAQDGDISKVIKFTNHPFTPQSFDTSKDEVEMQLMSSMPTSLGGSVGSANYSSEVDAAMQGAAINANARGTIVRHWLELVYKSMAELLMQEVSNEEIIAMCGPNAFLPAVYSEGEVARISSKIHAEAQATVTQEIRQSALQVEEANEVAIETGQAPVDFEPPDSQAIVARINQLVAQECMRVFGWPEPVSRETILRRMHCKVTVALNTQADRTMRLNAMKDVAATIQMFAQAAQSCGMIFDPNPLLKQVRPIFGGDNAILEMFKPMPPGAMPPPPGDQSLPPIVAGQNAPQDNASTQIPKSTGDNPTTQVDSPPSGPSA